MVIVGKKKTTYLKIMGPLYALAGIPYKIEI